MQRVIIFATTYFPLVGGAEVAMKEITDRLPNWQFDLFCARIQPGLKSVEKIGNITVHRVGFGHPIDKYLLPVFGPLAALCLPPTTYNLQPVLVWSLMASYGGFAALVYSWLRPGVRFLLTLQEGDPLEHYAKRAGRLEFLHKRIFQRADAVQAISRFLAEWAVRMGFKGTPAVIPNGVDIEKFAKRISPARRQELRTKLGLAEGDLALVTASRLSLKNGVDDLIRALNHLGVHYKVIIAGDGEDRDKLRVLAEQKGLAERVKFLGSKGHDKLPEILQACDIFIRPSLSEGLGNAFLEAIAAGLPIIGTPVGGIPDFLLDGHTGVFCQVRNPESIAQAVMRIQTEPGLRDRLTAQSLVLVRAKYDWDKIAQQMDELLNKMTSDAGRRTPNQKL